MYTHKAPAQVGTGQHKIQTVHGFCPRRAHLVVGFTGELKGGGVTLHHARKSTIFLKARGSRGGNHDIRCISRPAPLSSSQSLPHHSTYLISPWAAIESGGAVQPSAWKDHGSERTAPGGRELLCPPWHATPRRGNYSILPASTIHRRERLANPKSRVSRRREPWSFWARRLEYFASGPAAGVGGRLVRTKQQVTPSRQQPGSTDLELGYHGRRWTVRLLVRCARDHSRRRAQGWAMIKVGGMMPA